MISLILVIPLSESMEVLYRTHIIELVASIAIHVPKTLRGARGQNGP
jgi:hypothetical protein